MNNPWAELDTETTFNRFAKFISPIIQDIAIKSLMAPIKAVEPLRPSFIKSAEDISKERMFSAFKLGLRHPETFTGQILKPEEIERTEKLSFADIFRETYPSLKKAPQKEIPIGRFGLKGTLKQFPIELSGNLLELGLDPSTFVEWYAAQKIIPKVANELFKTLPPVAQEFLTKQRGLKPVNLNKLSNEELWVNFKGNIGSLRNKLTEERFSDLFGWIRETKTSTIRPTFGGLLTQQKGGVYIPSGKELQSLVQKFSLTQPQIEAIQKGIYTGLPAQIIKEIGKLNPSEKAPVSVGQPTTLEQFKNWDVKTPEGGSSKSPKTVMSWKREDYETLADLAKSKDTFRYNEVLGKFPGSTVPNSFKLKSDIETGKEITIYRARPKGSGEAEIIPGAYVSESLEYVKQHGENILGGDYEISSMKVSPDELMVYGDPHEFIYIPKTPEIGYERYKQQLSTPTGEGIIKGLKSLATEPITGKKEPIIRPSLMPKEPKAIEGLTPEEINKMYAEQQIEETGFSPEEQLELQSIIGNYKKELFKAIKSLGGIKSHEKGFLKEEFSQIPFHLKNREGMYLDEMVTELNNMGFQFENEEDLRQTILEETNKSKTVFRRIARIGRIYKPKIPRVRMYKPKTNFKLVGKPYTPIDLENITTKAQKALAYIIAKQKNLSPLQLKHFEKVITGKATMATPKTKEEQIKWARKGIQPMTKEDAQSLINALKRIVPKKPVITGQPPIIPTSKYLVPSEWSGQFNDLTEFQATPLSGLDPVRAAEIVDGKSYGIVRKTIVEPAREAERRWKNELKSTLDKLKSISRDMRSKSKEAELTFKFIENTLDIDESKLISSQIKNTAEYIGKIYEELLFRLNKVRALVNKIPIQKRQDYITHIRELSLLDEFYQGLSNVPDDVINIPAFAKSNSPFFKFALQRIGGKEFSVDAISAFRTYIEKAYPVIHNTEVLKSARPLVNRLPHNAYKYFTQYLDETMALRPSQMDKFIPRPLLTGISWLRRQMGKGAILGNLASVCNQIFTLPNIVSTVEPKFIASATLKMTNDEWRAFTEKYSKTLQSRIFEIDFDPTLLSKVDNALGFLIQYTDREMVRLAFGSAFEKALSNKIPFEEAVKYADDIAFKTQSGFNLTDLPPAFRSRIAGSFLQFQNTVNNGLNFLRFDLGKEGQKRGKWGVFKAGLAWLGTLLALNYLYRKMGIPTPIDEWTDIFPLVSMAEYGTPVTYSIPTALLSLSMAKTDEDRNKANRALYKSAFLFLPAGNQFRKTLEGIYVNSKGGKFNKKGRLLFPVNTLPEQIRSVAFGPYNTKAGQEYIKRGFKPEKGKIEMMKENPWAELEKDKILSENPWAELEMKRR